MAQKPPDPEYVLREEGSVHSLLFLDSALKKDKLLTGIEDGNVSEWNLKLYRKETTAFSAGYSSCLALRAYERTIVSQEKLGHIRFWTPLEASWQELNCVYLDVMGYCKIDIASDFGGVVACPSKNSTIEIYSVKDNRKLVTFAKNKNGGAPVGEVSSLRLIHLGGNLHVLVAFESGILSLYDYKAGKEVSSVKLENCSLSLDFDESSMKGICGSVNKTVKTFTISSEYQLVQGSCFKILNPGVNIVKIRPDKKIVLLGCWDGSIRIYSWKNLRPLAVLTRHLEEIQDIAFINNLFAAASKDMRVSFWNVYNDIKK